MRSLIAAAGAVAGLLMPLAAIAEGTTTAFGQISFDPDIQAMLDRVNVARDVWEKCIMTEAARQYSKHGSDTPASEQAVVDACHGEMEAYRAAMAVGLDPRGRDAASAAWEAAMLDKAPSLAGLAIRLAEFKATHPNAR